MIAKVAAFEPPVKHSIRLIGRRLPVSDLHAELIAPANHDLWNAFRTRTEQYAHSHVDDIWVRYNAWANYSEQEGLAQFNREHDSVWYPAYARLPALRPILFEVMRFVEGERLGGVLITRIPPGGQVHPHRDLGWHAGYYDKLAVQIAADPKQCFHFENEELVTEPGDLFTFDNSKVHWVTNDSDIDRITLIICIRLQEPHKFLWE